MKILVTGGAGFIGSHLVRRLLNEGHSVTVLDNLSSGSLENLKDIKGVEFIKHDTIDPIELPGFDQMYHLASLASPIFYQKTPVQTALSNSVGTYNLLMQAKKHGAHFLFTSTSEVYGSPLEHPQKESYWGNVNPNGPRSCYDESKRLGETLTMDFHRQYFINTRIARIFNTYGPRMGNEDGRIIPNFICQALAGKDLTVYGDGSQTRSFCYVSDTVEGLVRLMNSDHPEPINIGNPHELTVREIAEKILKLTGSKSKIAFKPLPVDDPHRRCPDMTKARSLLGFKPEVALEDGLKKTIEWYNSTI